MFAHVQSSIVEGAADLGRSPATKESPPQSPSKAAAPAEPQPLQSPSRAAAEPCSPTSRAAALAMQPQLNRSRASRSRAPGEPQPQQQGCSPRNADKAEPQAQQSPDATSTPRSQTRCDQICHATPGNDTMEAARKLLVDSACKTVWGEHKSGCSQP